MQTGLLTNPNKIWPVPISRDGQEKSSETRAHKEPCSANRTLWTHHGGGVNDTTTRPSTLKTDWQAERVFEAGEKKLCPSSTSMFVRRNCVLHLLVCLRKHLPGHCCQVQDVGNTLSNFRLVKQCAPSTRLLLCLIPAFKAWSKASECSDYPRVLALVFPCRS